MSTIKVGISACLTGEEVRYDGSHKLSRLCMEELARHFELVPVCPEVGIGMGVPRKPIRLVGEAADPRAVGVEEPDRDFSAALQEYARHMLPRLADLRGYIFIKGSPSCGLYSVKVHGEDGKMVSTRGRGIFAAEIARAWPELPVEEAGRLEDALVKENFIRRVHAMHRRRPRG